MASACQVILNRFLNEFHINLRTPADSVGENVFLFHWRLGVKKYAHSAFGDYKDGYDIDDSDLSHYDSIDSISTDYNYEDYDPTKYVRRNSKRNSVMCD